MRRLAFHRPLMYFSSLLHPNWRQCVAAFKYYDFLTNKLFHQCPRTPQILPFWISHVNVVPNCFIDDVSVIICILIWKQIVVASSTNAEFFRNFCIWIRKLNIIVHIRNASFGFPPAPDVFFILITPELTTMCSSIQILWLPNKQAVSPVSPHAANSSILNIFCTKIVCAMSFDFYPPVGIKMSSKNKKNMEKS